MKLTSRDVDDFAVNEHKSTIVKNLRNIWDSKKLEIQFTQVTAAKELGWSQGAISHYLNEITDLNPAAVIKFANFLDVDPREIDPDIEPNLPAVRNLDVKYSSRDMTKAINKKLSDRSLASSILVKVPDEGLYAGKMFPVSGSGMDCYMRLCKPSDLKHPKFFAVRLKGKKKLTFYAPDDLPDKKKIHALWSVVSISFY